MASDVRAALVEIMAGPSRLKSKEEAVKRLADMQGKGRYLQVRRHARCTRAAAATAPATATATVQSTHANARPLRTFGADCVGGWWVRAGWNVFKK